MNYKQYKHVLSLEVTSLVCGRSDRKVKQNLPRRSRILQVEGDPLQNWRPEVWAYNRFYEKQVDYVLIN